MTDTELLMEQWKKDRLESLLSLDVEKIRAYAIRWGEHGFAKQTNEAIIIGTHKAITAMKDAPMERRQESKLWLIARGFKAMDDGDV